MIPQQRKGPSRRTAHIFYLPEVGAYTVPTTTKVLTPGTTVQAPVEGLRE